MTVNVRLPEVLRLTPEAYIRVRIDPAVLESRAELAHWRLSTPEECEGGCLGEVVIPSETVDLAVFAHEAYHASLDLSMYHVLVEVSTPEEEISARHEAGALIMERLIGQVLFVDKVNANTLGAV